MPLSRADIIQFEPAASALMASRSFISADILAEALMIEAGHGADWLLYRPAAENAAPKIKPSRRREARLKQP